MNARYVIWGGSAVLGLQVHREFQIAALKLRQKAVADASPSIEKLAEYGF